MVADMEVLSMKSLPLGFRFQPKDPELIDYYLRSKINGNHRQVAVIREIDVCKWEPWDLPDLSVIQTTDPEWFFFCPLDRKYPNGHRLNRATIRGYWKATGKDRQIKSDKILIGMKKTLVFHTGRAPHGKRTNWVMHEYRTTQKELDGTNPGQSPFVLCRLFKKQDETIEDSNVDEAEPTASSSLAAVSSPQDVQSDLAPVPTSPSFERQDEKPLTKVECTSADSGNAMGSDTLPPLPTIEFPSNSCGGYDAEGQLNMPPGELDIFYDPPQEPLFSPVHSQMHAELGYYGRNDLSNDHQGVSSPYGTNEQDAYVSEFLSSILNSSGEQIVGDASATDLSNELGYYGRNDLSNDHQGVTPPYGTNEEDAYAFEFLSSILNSSGEQIDVDASATEVQFETELRNAVQPEENIDRNDPSLLMSIPEDYGQSSRSEVTSNRWNEIINHDAGTGIRIRARQTQNPTSAESFVTQGEATRRLMAKVSSRPKDNELKPIAMEVISNNEKKPIGAGTGIRIRARQTQNPTSAESFVTQGDAKRRIRLVTKVQGLQCSSRPEDNELKPIAMEDISNNEKKPIGAVDTDVISADIDLPEKGTVPTRPNFTTDGSIVTGKRLLSVLLKAVSPAAHSMWSLAFLFIGVVVAFLFIIC